MEVLFISHKYPPTIGGMEKQSFELIKEISKHHTVHKIAYNADAEHKASFILKLKARVRSVLKQNPKIEMIHLNDGAMGFFCFWLQKEVNIPITVTFHGLDIVHPNHYYQKYAIQKLKHYDGFICVSEATASECIKRGFDPNKTYVIPNGVDPSLAKMPFHLNGLATKIESKFNIEQLRDKKILVSLGRMTKRKGFIWFLENVVPELDDDTIFIMVGPQIGKRRAIWKKFFPKTLVNELELSMGAIDESYKLEEIIKNPKINNKVFIAGQLKFPDVMSLLSLAHIFVMPNIKVEGDAEGFGLVALEAAVRGTTVLASGIDGITAAIQDNKNGVLLPSQDKDAWVKAIKYQLGDLKSLEKQSKRFQEFTLENYTWKRMANSYMDVFHEVIDNCKSPSIKAKV